MKRRTCLTTMLAAGASSSAALAAGRPIQLHLDMSVDPAKEKELLHNFETSFRPAAQKQPGFLDVKLMKLAKTVQGKLPDGVNYRFMISFQTEEHRLKWVATAVHQKVWPMLENTLTTKNYPVLVFDVY